MLLRLNKETKEEVMRKRILLKIIKKVKIEIIGTKDNLLEMVNIMMDKEVGNIRIRRSIMNKSVIKGTINQEEIGSRKRKSSMCKRRLRK